MGCSVGLKYAKNALAAGAPPRTPLGGAHDALPDPLVGWGPFSRRLRCLDSRAFGASILVPPSGRASAPAALELATVLPPAVPISNLKIVECP